MLHKQVKETITPSPSHLRESSNGGLAISNPIVWKTLRYHLNKHAYYIQIVQKLGVEVCGIGQVVCYMFLVTVFRRQT